MLGRIQEVDHTAARGEPLEESGAPHMRRRSEAWWGIARTAAVTISAEQREASRRSLAFLTGDKPLQISRALFLICVNSGQKKYLADLRQTPTFLPRYLQERALDFARYAKSNPLIFCCHNLRGF